MAKFFPYWLSARDKQIAKALIENGCWFVGRTSDFCSPIYRSKIKVRSWTLKNCADEHFIELTRQDALFCCDVENKLDGEKQLMALGQAIAQAAEKWDADHLPDKQLSIFGEKK